ncbi:MAG: major facilitator superfamily domain-containing protein [Linnemannia elongata]|nr:MAG: major facilitator superfamily domain-containing protein [Linnemannia elongata]
MDLENKGVFVDGQESDARPPVSASKIIDRTLLSRKNIKYLYIAIMVQAFLRSFEVNLMYSSLSVISAVFESASIATILPIILEIISAALVPFYTKISDVVGRSQAMTIAAVMYLLGYTVQGTSNGFLQLALGQIVYGVGSTGLMTLAQVLIADITPLIDRGIMFALWGMPSTVNVFIATVLVDPLTIYPGANWRNVYAVIGTTALIGFITLLGPLWHYQRKAERRAASHGRRTETRSIGWLFSEFDAVGALLITMALGLTLLPIILARSYDDNWKSPRILGMFFSGVVSWVLLVVWEVKFSTRPIMPMRIWFNRTSFGALAVGFFLTVINAMNYNYYTLYLVVSRDISYGRATLLERGYQVIYPVCELLTGFAMKRFKICRPFIWIGIFVQTIGLGLQIPARKPSSSDAFIVIAQIIAGGGAGMANNAAIVAVTGSVARDDVATAIGVIHILSSFGYALGSGLAGGIWTQYLPMRLAKHITGPYDERLAMNDPLKYIPKLDVTTKGELVEAYADSQMLMLIIAMCLAVPVCITTLFMKHIDLLQDQRDEPVEGEGEAYAIDGLTSEKPEVK